MSEMTVFWWFLLKLVWPNCLGFLECFWVWALKVPQTEIGQSQVCWEVGHSKVKSFLFFLFLPSLPLNLLSFPLPSFLFSLASPQIFTECSAMSISVLSGSEIVVSRTDIFHLLFELTVMWQNLTGCRVMSEWKGQVETILGKNNGTQGYSIWFSGYSGNNWEQNRQFSLLWIAFRFLCVWVGVWEDNQQVNSEFSEKQNQMMRSWLGKR